MEFQGQGLLNTAIAPLEYIPQHDSKKAKRQLRIHGVVFWCQTLHQGGDLPRRKDGLHQLHGHLH
jgi:hypothetical protein